MNVNVPEVSTLTSLVHEPLKPDLDHLGELLVLEKRDRLFAFLDDVDFKMILKVLPDSGDVGHDRNSELVQVVGIADPGEHEQLRRVYRSATQNDFIGKNLHKP